MELKEKALVIIKKLVREGFVAYFAGGYVRDYLMGNISSDIDIATDAPPSKILDLFSHTIPVGLAFGVVIVVIEGHAFEVSTFRKDILYLNGRTPSSIELSSAKEDAIRRDFTINGLFLDPLEGFIYDYVGGKEDIKNKIIRTIGSPFERFSEDRLRMIRAVRFAARFGFLIDPDTEEGILENKETLFPAVAMERIWQEFNKMSKSDTFAHALIDLHRLGLLQVIFPDLQHVHLNDIKHIVSCFKYFPKNTPTIIYLMELFPDFSLNQLKNLCAYLKISKSETKVAFFHYNYRKLIMKKEGMNLWDLVYFYANKDSLLVLQVEAAHLERDEAISFLEQHESKKLTLKNHIERVIKNTPLVNGALLAKYGVPEGKKMGLLLNTAEEIAILNDLNDKETVIEILKKMPIWE